MNEISEIEKLEELQASGAVFILFGGKHCNVCHALRPQLENMLQSYYPEIISVYIDCEVSPEICAQHSVFTLPVVQFYIENKKVTEFARSFSIQQLNQSMHRAYTIWQDNQ
ncbi:MAG: thioredoxin family protein [Gammaproteobacteria bacterium]|nr:thioredoxin family protein [Gammaproteobacteria bacterium]NNJ50781.1 thioredoxin family protein [Gammaproteobacteria bacterium]